MSNLIIFDMDDVLWSLNDKASKMAGVDINKLTTFLIYENPNLNEEQKQRILDAYAGTELYRDIKFCMPVVQLVNEIYHDYLQYEVEIRSNCASVEIRDIKMEQLLPVLDLPEEKIHLHVINMYTKSHQKKFPDNIYMVVDDSPHNIIQANARVKIMPARPWNNVLVDNCLGGCPVIRPKGPANLIEAVKSHL